MERLQKYISRCGIASRRRAEQMILEGRVSVNGRIVKELGVKIEESDRVTVDGKEIYPQNELIYIALNKPRKVVSTCYDPQGRTTVLDLLPDDYKVYPIGRLDYMTEGLLLLTNDGEFANLLMHPRYEIAKTYRVAVKGYISDQALNKLAKGVMLEDGPTLPAEVEVLERTQLKSVFLLTIREGRNRQVRRMCTKVGFPVTELQRIQIGPVKLGNLRLGRYRQLKSEELKKLRNIAITGNI